MDIKELRKYKENSWYSVDDIAGTLMNLSNVTSDDAADDVRNALYQIKAMAQNSYNCDYWRTLYNVLLIMAGIDYGEGR